MTKREQQYQERYNKVISTLKFHEDEFVGMYATCHSTTEKYGVYVIDFDPKWLYSTGCSCPAKGDCLHRFAFDRYCDQYRPTFKQQCDGVTVSREVIDRLLLNGKEAPAVQEAPAVKVYYCVVEKSGIKFIPVQYTEYGKFTSLNEGFYSSDEAYNWLEAFLSSTTVQQVAAQEEAKAEAKMQAWKHGWEEQYSQDSRIEASRIGEVGQEDGTRKEIAVYRPVANLQENIVEDMAA